MLVVIRSRRGSSTAEAAMILPLLILSVLTCLLVAMFFYESASVRFQAHLQLRAAADDLTGCTFDLNRREYQGTEPEVRSGGAFRVVSTQTRTVMLHRLLLRRSPAEDAGSCWHASDGPGYVRRCLLAKGVIGKVNASD